MSVPIARAKIFHDALLEIERRANIVGLAYEVKAHRVVRDPVTIYEWRVRSTIARAAGIEARSL